MLLLTHASATRSAALGGRLVRSGAMYLDAASLEMAPFAVRAHIGTTDRTWLIRVPESLPLREAAYRYRRPGERVAEAVALTSGDLGTLLSDAIDVPDAEPSLPEIRTERTVLGFPTTDQIDRYHDAIAGSDMFDTILWDGPNAPSEMHDYWHRTRQLALDGLDHPLSFGVIERSTGHYVGGVALRPVGGDPRHLDVGYAFEAAARGRGLATEALSALCDEAFRNRGAERIIAGIFVGNHASRRVTEKLGFRPEGTLRSAVVKRGQRRDEWLMARTREDWLADQG